MHSIHLIKSCCQRTGTWAQPQTQIDTAPVNEIVTHAWVVWVMGYSPLWEHILDTLGLHHLEHIHLSLADGGSYGTEHARPKLERDTPRASVPTWRRMDKLAWQIWACRRCVTSTGQTVISKSTENIQLRLSSVLRMMVMLRGSFPLLTK